MDRKKKQLSDKWLSYDGIPELNGLSPNGFNGNTPLKILDFDLDELNWAFDFALTCGEPIQNINRKHTSYGLKHLAERWAEKRSDNQFNYISNGSLILAMIAAGFHFIRYEDSPNVCFNVSERALKKIEEYCLGL